ncbi:MAG: T9SS type A sorting domain-containing protein [bacterium]
MMFGTLQAAEVEEEILSNNQGYEFDFISGAKQVNLMVPRGSIGAEVDLKFSFSPLTRNFEVNPGLLQQALNNLDASLRYTDSYIVELALYVSGQARTTTFQIPLKLEINYQDADQNGMVDGMIPLIFEEKLRAYYLDASNAWQLHEDQEQDTTQNTVTLYISNPGTFALIGEVNYSNDPDQVKIYPNPYRPGSLSSFDATGITFDKITNDSEIQIYNVNGELLKVLKETDTDGRVFWDGKNTHGRSLVTGVYMALIKGSSDKKIYKFAIER